MATGTAVATLATSDPDAGDTHTFSLVSGTGDADNAAFAIVGSQLRTAAAINFEVKPSYWVRVRATDAGGLYDEGVVTVSVTDLNEAPLAVNDVVDPALQVVVGSITVNVLANDSDPDSNPLFNLLSVSAVGTPASGSATTDGTSVTYTPPAGANGTVTFPYTLSDNGGLTDIADISLAYVANTTRGDCNADTPR